MWEIIQLNKRKTYLLMSILAMNCFAFGAIIPTLIGYLFVYDKSQLILIAAVGGGTGLLIFFLSGLTSYLYANEIILSRCGARRLTPSMHPQLFNVLEEVLISSNSSFVPELYATPSMAPNAFATGINVEKSAIVVTTGLLTQLNRNQLQGVIAHELAHIINRDTLYLTMAGTILNIKAKAGLMGNYSYSYNNGLNNDNEDNLFKFLYEIFEYINELIYFSLSKNREYLADATSVRLTRFPEGLASALEKISGSKIFLHEARRATAPFYIVNPINKNNSRTHPPVEERVKILRNITKGANYRDYQNSYNSVLNTTEAIFPGSALDEEYIPLKNDKDDKEQGAGKSIVDIIRETRDLNEALENYRFIVCNCGMKLKISPDFKRDSVHCPRCGKLHNLSTAVDKEPDSPYKETPFEDWSKDVNGLVDGNIYIRKNKNSWESFFCDCGFVLQLSPNFRGKRITCIHCNREIKIKKNEEISKADKIREVFRGEDRNDNPNHNEVDKEDVGHYIMTHTRTGDNWEFFSCKCGNVIQLSEGFRKDTIHCPECNGTIKIEYTEKMQDYK